MREIEFRGKRIDNDEWIYGYCTYNDARRRCEIDGVFVNPHSISQYTGRKDKNGKKIFEYDIVKQLYGVGYPSKYHPSFASGTAMKTTEVIEYNEEFAGYKFLTAPYDFNFECEYEVIGNVFDNHELYNEIVNEIKEHMALLGECFENFEDKANG